MQLQPETPAEEEVARQLSAALSLWNDKQCARAAAHPLNASAVERCLRCQEPTCSVFDCQQGMPMFARQCRLRIRRVAG